MMEEERLGKDIIDGQMVDYDKMSKDDFDKLIEKLEKQENALKEEIESLLKD